MTEHSEYQPPYVNVEKVLARVKELEEQVKLLEAALRVKDSHNHFDCTAERSRLQLEVERLASQQGIMNE